MGDRRFLRPYARIRNASHPARAIRALDDDDVVSALAASSAERDQYLANVLATELHNRLAQRGRLERALRRSKEQLRTVLSGAPLFIAAIDREGTIILFQGRALDDTGMEQGALEGRSVFDAFAHRPEVLARVRRAMAGEVVERPATMWGRDYLARYSPICGADGTVDGVVAVSVDVTAQQQEVEAAHRAEEARYRLIAEATNDALWDWDVDADAVWWSDGYFKVFGHDAAELERTKAEWERHVHPDDRDAVVASVEAAIDGDADLWEGEYRFLCGDGAYAPVHDRARIVRDAEGRVVRMAGAIVRAERAVAPPPRDRPAPPPRQGT